MSDGANPLDGLEERLKSHSKAFESLLALTPAQEYYGSAVVDGRDPSEQWRAKKQTKAEKRAARMAKLDPANQKSALDIMKEREKKRKRELGMDSGEDEEDEAVDTFDAAVASKKRPKIEEAAPVDEDKRREKAEKRREKREKKKEKLEKQKVKQEVKRSKKQAASGTDTAGALDDAEADADGTAPIVEPDVEMMDIDGLAESDGGSVRVGLEPVDTAGRIDGTNSDDAVAEQEGDSDAASSTPSSPLINSPAFDISANHSTTSSSSSILPPSLPDSTEPSASKLAQAQSRPSLNLQLPRPPSAASLLKALDSDSRTSSPKPQFPKVDQAILQERLRVRIEELRAKRKADGADGQPATSRQELLEQRRKKADQRKAHKKELRRQAKEEEERKQEERLRGSGSPLSGADIFSPRSESNSFSFSRLAFSDGSMADASLSKLVDAPKQKGPQDPKTALLAAESKQKRLAGLDEQKRADIGEKDRWLNASKRAHGERIRDDQSLLKKALKRKEKQKSKSEKEWQERGEAVVKGKEMKQKRRDDNLAKRRDEKGGKKKPVKKGAKKGRPGFEGRFKA